jgi:hypothetical protein
MVDASILEKLRQAALRRGQKKNAGMLSFSQESLVSTQPVSQLSRVSPDPPPSCSTQRVSLVSRSIGISIDTAEMGTSTLSVSSREVAILPIICIDAQLQIACDESVQTDVPYPADIPPIERHQAEDVLADSDIVLLLSEIHSIVSLYPKPPTTVSEAPRECVADDVDEDAILELFIRNDENLSPKICLLQDSPPSTPQAEDVWESVLYTPSEVLLTQTIEKVKRSRKRKVSAPPRKKKNVVEVSPAVRRSCRINSQIPSSQTCPPVESLLKRLKHVVQFTCPN